MSDLFRADKGDRIELPVKASNDIGQSDEVVVVVVGQSLVMRLIISYVAAWLGSCIHIIISQ